MLVDKFKNIAEGLGMDFSYARRDFANLLDANKTNTYLILDPITRRTDIQDGDFSQNTYYTGWFSILTWSELDEGTDYDDRYKAYMEIYQNHIKPKISVLYDSLFSAFGCDKSYSMDSLEITDVINAYDTNLSGILVKFKISKI